MSEKLPVVAAIPNYNMSDSLRGLLPQVLKQGYDQVYVLDDASTDESKATVDSFGDSVKFIEGKQNLGGGGNRNRVIDELATTSIIHFLDADVSLESEHMADTIRAMKIDESFGFVGGLVLDETGDQSIWNYGPRQTFVNGLTAGLLWRIGREEIRDKNVPRTLLRILGHLYRDRPVPGITKFGKRRAYWVLECNLVIRSDTLKRLGGFDETIREHDIQPLAYEAEKAGLYNIFAPSLAVRQHDVNVREYNRDVSKLKAEMYLAKKYGIARWLFNTPSKKV